MEFKKNRCIYHQEQAITNFCKDTLERCLMPLCPSCISQHSEYHQQYGHPPIYENINDTIISVHNSIAAIICSLESDRYRNHQLMNKIAQIPQYIHQQILSTKKAAHQIIDDAFEDLQRQILAKLKQFHSQMNLYCLQSCRNYEQKLSRSIEQLNQIDIGLKGIKCLTNTIYFMKDKQEDMNYVHSKISAYLNSNEHYEPQLQLNMETQQRLYMIITHMLKIKEIEYASNDKPKSILSNNFDNVQNKNIDKYGHKIMEDNSNYLAKSRKNANNHSPYKQIRSKNKGYKQQYEKLSKQVNEIRQNNQIIYKNLRAF